MTRRNILSNNYFEEEFAYSRAVRVGDHVHVAGTCARPPHDEGGAYEQSAAALEIIAAALSEAGADIKDVVRTVVYVTDMSDMKEVARAHRERFTEVKPASTLVQVAALAKPHLRVEIEAYAILTEG